MPRFSHIKNSFLAGEISPKAYGRTDLPILAHGCETMENMLPMPQGGATRRPGTIYVKNTASNAVARLVPFVFSLSESYIFEFTNNVIRAVNGSSFTDTAIYPGPPNATGYTTAQLMEIQFAQSGDDIILTHPDKEPQVIRRTAANGFSMYRWDEYLDNVIGTSSLKNILAQPFRDINTTAITMTPSVTTGTGTLTASSAFFQAGHDEGYFLVDHAGTIGACQITSIVSSTVANITTHNDFGATTASANWYEGSWSTYRGFPRTVAFYEGRLVFGGNSYEPDTLWGSKFESYPFMCNLRGINGSGHTGTLAATDPYAWVSAQSQANQFQWLSNGKTLASGSLGSEQVIYAPNEAAITASQSPVISTESHHGSAFVQAKRIGYSVVSVQRSGRRLHEQTFDFNSDSYVTDNLSDLGEHIVRRSSAEHATVDFSTLKIVQIDYQETPNKIIWAVDSAGGLISCTRDKQNNIKAWAYHKLGGRYRPASTDEAPLVKSVAVIPSPNGTADRVFLSVSRYNATAATTHNYIEYMDKEFEGDDFTDENPIFLDCCEVATSGSPTTAWTGFTHLQGETVSVLADGFTHANVTISGTGTFSTTFACSKVIVGFANVPIIKTLRLDAGSAFGSAQGSKKRIDRVAVHFWKTASAKVGRDSSNVEDINFRTVDMGMDDNIPLFTGQKVIKDFMGDWDEDGYVYITSEDPLPLTVTHITARGVTNEA